MKFRQSPAPESSPPRFGRTPGLVRHAGGLVAFKTLGGAEPAPETSRIPTRGESPLPMTAKEASEHIIDPILRKSYENLRNAVLLALPNEDDRPQLAAGDTRILDYLRRSVRTNERLETDTSSPKKVVTMVEPLTGDVQVGDPTKPPIRGVMVTKIVGGSEQEGSHWLRFVQPDGQDPYLVDVPNDPGHLEHEIICTPEVLDEFTAAIAEEFKVPPKLIAEAAI